MIRLTLKRETLSRIELIAIPLGVTYVALVAVVLARVI